MIARVSRRVRGERGFTLIELLIAAMLLAIGVLALVSSFDTSRALVSVAERNEAMTHQAEREMERILALEYDEIAMRSRPNHDNDEDHPAFHVLGVNYRWDQSDATGPRQDQMIVDSARGFAPVIQWRGELLSDGSRRFSGEIHRFVTEIFDPQLVQSPDRYDAKRVTLAVTLDGDEQPTKPLLISSVVVDKTPETGP